MADVESLIRSDDNNGDFDPRAPPADYKFMVFGDKVAASVVTIGKETSKACLAWFDEDYNRQDLMGCVCSNMATTQG